MHSIPTSAGDHITGTRSGATTGDAVTSRPSARLLDHAGIDGLQVGGPEALAQSAVEVEVEAGPRSRDVVVGIGGLLELRVGDPRVRGAGPRGRGLDLELEGAVGALVAHEHAVVVHCLEDRPLPAGDAGQRVDLA